MERISRMEKAFYPRNDTVNAVISNLLPRDGQEDILIDQSGDPVYLQRSTVLDGTNVKGFGYVGGKPYKWRLEIETAVKSVAVVPDRFFSVYGKSYPIKKQQTVGINQPSELFKYEIIYLRGYDAFITDQPKAKIIYHSQAEGRPITDTRCSGDAEALNMLDNYNDYPFLKIRVCWDGSIRAYLGKIDVDWDLERDINSYANVDTAWVEIPQINTDQFRDIDLWVRFDSINALSYYLITKYENNIFSIGPKNIINGIPRSGYWEIKAGTYKVHFNEEDIELVGLRPVAGPLGGNTYIRNMEVNDIQSLNPTMDTNYYITLSKDYNVYQSEQVQTKTDAIYWAIQYEAGLRDTTTDYPTPARIMGSSDPESTEWFKFRNGYAPGGQMATDSKKGFLEFVLINGGDASYIVESGSPRGHIWARLIKENGSVVDKQAFTLPECDPEYRDGFENKVRNAVGFDYALIDPTWTKDTSGCTPCCKKDNLSRAIWAYVNPKTMTPYDDDYWFHAGEPYYKKSLTLSTKENPLKAQKIVVEQGVFPGMYKIVAETLIRERETGEDQRVQISLPLCKIKSDQTLTLQADGDPTTFNLDVEVATPPNGIPMEITFYEVEKEMKAGCSGSMVPKDGSTRISAQ